ncbi:MAG: family 43 glycosylhydrolase [Eubacterium sp.]|nr:family 43 glycosylhydrolase [Eubacterium sp.]
MKNTSSIYPNPFILERADPYIVKGSDNYYYFTASYPMKSEQDKDGYDRVILRRSKTIEGLADADEITIWKSEPESMSHRFIWAPELHEIQGKWYVFYAGSDKTDDIWAINCHVLQCAGNDPYSDAWVEKGKFQRLPEDDFSFSAFSLDMTYYEDAGKSYVIWAQHSPEKISCLYMATVDPKEPWKLTSLPMLLTEPEYDWEKVRFPVNEGPAVLKKDDTIFVCFSASGTGPEYCVGTIYAKSGSNLMDKTSWTKLDYPLLTSEDLVDEYGPGHNSFVKDAEGNDIFVYHARSKECFEGRCGYSGGDPLFDPCRHARLNKVSWSSDNLPILAPAK